MNLLNLFKQKVEEISPQEAKQKMLEEDCVVLDVREIEEYNDGHIEGALLIPLGNLIDDAYINLPEKSQLILVYCLSGARAKEAVNILKELGYLNVYSFGGILNWPYELVK